MSEIQNVTDRLMSPTCYTGQHEDCKQTVSWIGEDGVSRTMVCACRCHDRAPEAKSSENPEVLYLLTWEYEVKQRIEGNEEEQRAWIKRKVITTSKGQAGDWIDAVAELTATNQVRNLVVLKTALGKWEKVQ